MTNKELGAKIRSELKAAGYPARAISVRVNYCGYSTSVSVTIKDINISLSDVEKIVNKYKDIDYDERSGEILMGGNTYVSVRYDYDLLDAEREKYMAEAQEIIDNNKQPHVGVEIAKDEKSGNRLLYFFESPGSIDNAVIIYQHIPGLRSYYHDRYIAHNAYHLAEALAHFKARGSFI